MGDKNQVLNDYANRTWAGLVSGYYRVRWEKFFNEAEKAIASGGNFEYKVYADIVADFEVKWWRECFGNYNAKPEGDSFLIAKKMYDKIQWAYMCFYFKQSKDALTLAKRFKVKVNENDSFVKGEFNAFTFPRVPVITDKARDRIFGFNWGLIPDYESDISIRKFTLNGRIETLDSVRSYRNYIQNDVL